SRLSGLGTKGGSGLMFDEDPGNQKVVLGSGSNRGSISLTTNSPTTALIQADVVNSMTMVNASMSALDTTFTTGADFVVKAENSDLTHIMSIIQGLQTAAQATSSVANTISAFDGNEEVSDADLTAKWASLMNFTAYTLFKASTLYSNIKKLLADPLPMLPHKPMLALEVNNNGASGAWRSQRTTNVDIVAWVSLLSNFVKLAKPIDDAVQNIAEDIDSNPNDSPDIKKLNKDKTELQKKVAALGDSDTDKIKKEIIQSKIDDINSQILKLNEQLEKNKNKLSKKLSLASNVGSETVDVIFNIISLVTSIWAMKKPYKSLEGILINNLDSYVSIQANNHISMSGYGPTIIESSKALLGDLLRFGLYETNLPTKLIIPESSVTLASFGTASFKKSKAILLRSDIIRSRANEISLQATDAIFSQATNQIQLITGIKPANITRKTAITAAEQAYNTSYNLAEAAEDNSPDKAEKIQATYPFAHTLLNLDHPTVAESTFTKGIYLKTEEASMPILIATANSDSKITLAQSVADIATNENDRYLELNKDFVHLQNCKNSLLHLSDKNAELKADENSYLKIGSQTINLSSTNKTNLTMNATDATLKGETGVVLTANNGQNSLTINSQGIALKVGGSSVKLTPAVAQMMS
ncbi:MAG: FlxA-like family protein, partial [Deltaproteobacteria bacterium]|nr:FlxA-like family protein [Deltaproteobacteria bacterium]